MGIIGNPLCACSASQYLIQVFGANNEVISYSGSDSGSVTLDIDGEGYLALSPGTYTFVGGKSGYSKTISISSDCAVYVRPVGSIYWYGLWVEPGLFSYATDAGAIDNDTYFRWAFPVKDTWHAVYANNKGVGYTTCSIKYRGYFGTTYCRLGYGVDRSPNTSGTILAPNFSTVSTTDWNVATLEFTPEPEGSKTIRIYGDKYNGRGYYIEIQEWYLGDR